MNFAQVRGQLQKNGVIKFILQSGLLSNTNFIKIINRRRCSSILYSYFAHNITFNCFLSIVHQNYGSRTAYLQNMEAFSYHQVCLFRGSIWVFFEFWLLIFCPNLLIWKQLLGILCISTGAISLANVNSQFSSEATQY